MEELLRKAVRTAPIPTLATALIYFIISKVLTLEIEQWVVVIAMSLVFIFSLSLIMFYRKKRESKVDEDNLIIEKNDIASVDTGGGDFILGAKGRTDETSGRKTISDNKVTDITTESGDFVIGEKKES